MTTNRINHTGHNHPATPAARAACRKLGTAPVATRVTGEHCRQCGTADESNRYNDGYSSCCNMRIVFTCDPTDCFHQ